MFESERVEPCPTNAEIEAKPFFECVRVCPCEGVVCLSMVKSMFFEPFRYPLNPQLPNPKALDPRSLSPKSMNNSAVSWLTPALPPTRALAFALARALARLHPRDRSLFLVASLSLSLLGRRRRFTGQGWLCIAIPSRTATSRTVPMLDCRRAWLAWRPDARWKPANGKKRIASCLANYMTVQQPGCVTRKNCMSWSKQSLP